MPRISYLDFSADDPERAVNFYNKVFGWQINKWDGLWNIGRLKQVNQMSLA
jgi:predicted enzyme related to lactoylglutathione lyase